MTLNDLECQKKVLWIFWQFRAATQVYIIHKMARRYCSYAI